MIGQIIFVVAVALLFTHELDAIKRHEWRLMPIINRLSDETGYVVFVIAHIPLFGLLLWAINIPQTEVGTPFQIAISVFCVVHALLHYLYKNHPANEFNNPLSQFLIWGAGIAGVGHILSVVN